MTTARFDFVADGPVDVAETPQLSLSGTPLGNNPVLFAKAAVIDTDGSATVIDEQVLPYRIQSFPGRRTTIAFDMVAFQRYLAAGQGLRLLLSATGNGYARSRRSAGTIVHHDTPGASTLTVPVDKESEPSLVGQPPIEG